MENLVAVDTDAVIDFFTARPPFAEVVANLIKAGRLALTSISAFELYAGVTGSKRLKQAETFCTAVPVFPVDLLAAVHAARIYTDLKAKGAVVGNQDLLIAGVCLARSVPLLTRNKAHFERIRGLKLFKI